jgi:hypothetical protein
MTINIIFLGQDILKIFEIIHARREAARNFLKIIRDQISTVVSITNAYQWIRGFFWLQKFEYFNHTVCVGRLKFGMVFQGNPKERAHRKVSNNNLASVARRPICR